jgi:CBS domain-containing protein
MQVADVISSRKEVFSVQEDATVHDVARYLRDRRVRTVGVLDAGGKLVGVISQADISDRVAAENKCPAWMRVSEVMTKDLVAVSPERAIEECLVLMEKHRIFHLVVSSEENNKFLGMISVKDLLWVIASDHKERADLMESFVFPQR